MVNNTTDGSVVSSSRVIGSSYRNSKYVHCAIQFPQSTIDQLVGKCQTVVFHYYETQPQIPLYNPTAMRDFCKHPS